MKTGKSFTKKRNKVFLYFEKFVKSDVKIYISFTLNSCLSTSKSIKIGISLSQYGFVKNNQSQ